MSSVPRHKAIIIGAGPAGLFAATQLAQTMAAASTPTFAATPASESGILLLDRRERPGRKLLISGSGQCNITHAGKMADFLDRYGGGAGPEAAGRFLKPALYAFTNEELLSWFRARGIDFETEESGKIFPIDRRAASILKILLAETERLGVTIEPNRRVSGIERGADCFFVHAEISGTEPAEQGSPVGQTDYIASAVLIATGGASYPRTGSSGDGYTLAASLGHHIVPPRPSLAPVFVKDFTLAALAGLSFQNAGLTIKRGGKKAITAEGDLLITHEGLSGPLILDASRHIAPGDSLEINFTGAAIEEFRSRLDAELKANPRRLVRTALADLGLTKSMAELFCDLVGIAKEETSAALTRARREALCRLACSHPFEVDRLGDLDTAMATAGGVDLSEVNPKTLESRLAPGLFFAGEVLDIDGDTGGYNLQAAFSTGALAACGVLVALQGSGKTG